MNLIKSIKNRNLLFDGAFGTYYAEKFQTNESPELANILYKERVLQIHDEYLKAGADVIRTNTFASNTVSLKGDMSEVRGNIKQAVELAKSAVAGYGTKKHIAASIGPIRDTLNMSDDEMRKEYAELVYTFVEEGIDFICFESFSDIEVILPVIENVKSKYDITVSLSFAVNQLGYTLSGVHARRLIGRGAESDAVDIIGLNCGVGPHHMYEILKNAVLPENKYVMALPNAGYPVRARSMYRFESQPDYFSEKMAAILELGVDVIGGCCGTNPVYTRHMSGIGQLEDKHERADCNLESKSGTDSKSAGFLYDHEGERKKGKLIAVELSPPFNADDERLLESAHILKNLKVDVLTFPDSPSGRTRVDSVLMANKVYRETGITVMPHICCRDRNAVAMRSLFMGAKINDIENFLVITGDPVPSDAGKTIKPVFNFDSVGLMKILKEMNEEIFCGKNICYGGAINQNLRNTDVVIQRVKKKMDAGARFFFTQPVFTKEQADKVRYIKESTGACIFCGIMPLISKKNALFMKNEISGINVTDQIVDRYENVSSKEEGENVGIALAREVISMVEDFADGYYFSFPFNKVHMLKDILD